ncbi:MAG: FMN-binding negative transcriptional regulator [Neisseriaceae bacterium]|nr:FMN-binding negative transcriptional regulator [Neisseriaceae bacterium]
MHLPAVFVEDDLQVQANLIYSHPLGQLISFGTEGLEASALPFLVDVCGDQLVLRTHFSKANQQWRRLNEAQECMVIFQADQGYISPSWYPSKQQGGKVVPTWDYATVHVWGRPKLRHEPEWLMQQLHDLTQQHEAERQRPWAMSDAPTEFIAAQLKGIVGMELRVSKRQGKFKMSQNRSQADVDGVVAGLTAMDPPQTALAAAVQRRRPKSSLD